MNNQTPKVTARKILSYEDTQPTPKRMLSNIEAIASILRTEQYVSEDEDLTESRKSELLNSLFILASDNHGTIDQTVASMKSIKWGGLSARVETIIELLLHIQEHDDSIFHL